MSDQTDNVIPSDKWTFDESVTNVFDDMLRRSIPQYQVMRDACTSLAVEYCVPNTAIIDLGSSRGEAIAPLVNHFGPANTFICVEASQPMNKVCKERFAGHIADGVVQVLDMDLRHDFPEHPASIVMSILTLQFTPIEYRLQILQKVYDTLLPGGAFICVEKLIGSSAKIDQTFTKLYYYLKAEHQYSQEQIASKRKSLEGVLVPLTAKWNQEQLELVGFRQVDCFWRWMNFAGWIAIK